MKGHDTMGKDLKGKELGKGISQRKDGRYQARFTDRFGKRRCVYGITLKEVKNALMSEVVDNYSKNNVVDSNMTLDQWYEKWMRVYKEPVLKPSTIRIYIRTYHCYIKPVLGRLPLSSITKLMVTDLLNELGKKLHKSTVNNIRTVLCDLFSYAMDNDLCTKNPVKGIKIIGADRRKIVTLSREDQRDFFFMAKGCFYYNLYIVAVNTGLRSGELRALTLDDIDFENNTINVTKTLTYFRKSSKDDFLGYKISIPKTKSSIRTVPMNSICRKAIEDQVQQLNTLPPIDYDSDVLGKLLFVTRNNRPLMDEVLGSSIRTVRNNVNKIRASQNQPLMPKFSAHTFRHTFATRCFEAGIPPKTVQAYLGHTSLQMTMDIYTEVLIDKKMSDIKLLENMMNDINTCGEFQKIS